MGETIPNPQERLMGFLCFHCGGGENGEVRTKARDSSEYKRWRENGLETKDFLFQFIASLTLKGLCQYLECCFFIAGLDISVNILVQRLQKKKVKATIYLF